MVPVIYGLLPDRTVQTYIRMFHLIQQYCQTRNIVFNPQLFQIDYEVAAKKAIEEVFGMEKVRGCLFHFAQCVWRKVQENGLVVEYNANEDVNRMVRRLLALPLIPLEQIDNVWMEIHAEAPNTSSVHNLMDYMVKIWIGENAKFKRQMWNHHNNYGPRTTNHLEGWHSGFNKKFNSPHPTFFQFLDVLKGEQNRFEEDIESRGFGHPNPIPRKAIRDRNKRIMDLKEQAQNNEITWLEFAGACGYLLPSQLV
ncbi:uncharacterized protein B4U80_00804 [Leptotrombidium deliense]|uniref:MULE transposase domain-containing protein n=1 Tax=Leptotrombidium deliense TaxID=299467 RepID=A0A443S502_9ACAR|nr:uncharacterized protein B4U80_00804 [Leptotrombidium deliense]